MIDFSTVEVKRPHPGVETRRIDFDQMTVVEYRFAAGAAFPMHFHPEEQMVVVLDGEVCFTVGPEAFQLAQGGSARAGANVPHGAVAEAGGARLLNILAPRRVGDGITYAR